MSVQVYWDNPRRTVLRWVFEDGWTWDDLIRAHAQGSAMMQEVLHSVDSIVDLSRSHHLPPNVMSMYKIWRERLLLPENRGMTLVCGCSGALRMLIFTFGKISNFYSHDFSLVESVAEARAILGTAEEPARV